MEMPNDMDVSQEPQATTPEPAPRRLPWWVTLIAFGFLLAFLYMLWQGLAKAQQGPVAVGQPAPQFALATFDQQEFRTEAHAGKLVVINFWASWCLPCEEEAAALEEAWRYYEPGGEVVFVGVNYVDTEPEALDYLEEFQITYPNGPDKGTVISRTQYRISGVPETYIIGRSGELEFVKKGPFTSTGEIIAIIDGLLAE